MAASAVKVFKHLKVIFEGWIYLSFHILRKKVIISGTHFLLKQSINYVNKAMWFDGNGLSQNPKFQLKG